jgi:hypothetical protein
VRRAFDRVMFYREQCAVAGRLLAEPEPTPLAALPQPPHTLCPFARPWSAEREPSLWTPTLGPLARALRMAGCRGNIPVLEVREALLDHTRLSRFGARPAYRVLLSATAIVASDAHREELNRRALAVAEAAGGGLVIGGPEELAALPYPDLMRPDLIRPVHRLPVAAVADPALPDVPALLYEPMLGYLGARVPRCEAFHLDRARVYARERDGTITISLPRSRRPTLLDIVPPGASTVRVRQCPRHGTPVLVAATG